MKKFMKKVAGLGMAAVMALSMSAMAFAQDAPGYVTFFKSGSATEVSMTQNTIGSYASKVQVVDGEDVNYVYTINLQSFTMTKMGISGEGQMTGIVLGSAAQADGITAVLADDLQTLVVTVPADLVDSNGNSATYAAEAQAEVELFWGITFDMPSSINLAITNSQLTYSE
ncbi:MAG: hypothetical protein AB7E42_05530 [Anaerotignaceae bacterium]